MDGQSKHSGHKEFTLLGLEGETSECKRLHNGKKAFENENCCLKCAKVETLNLNPFRKAVSRGGI